MVAEPVTCVNHPDTPTRLSCARCDDPICPRCVRTGAVGQRCPKCARPDRAVRPRGKPIHYARAVGAGGAVSVGGGLVVALAGFGSLILSGALGYFVGKAVGWGARGQTQAPFPAIAGTVAVMGLLLAYTIVLGTPVPQSPFRLLGLLIAAYLALRGLQS